MKWLLGLYPLAWRRRYGDEFLALLETQQPGVRLTLDVLVGALDAWLRPQVSPVSSAAPAGPARRGRAKPFDKFTVRSRSVLKSAAEEADLMHHDFIGTEHLLLGLLHEPKGVAMGVLRSFDVDPADVRAAVEARVGSVQRKARAEHGLSPRAKKVIHLSVEEAQRLRHPFVGTEHILLGLVREGHGIAAEVLAELCGVDLDEVRRRVVRVLNER